MLVAVAIALLIGIPLGILAGRHPKFDSALRGFLDAAQTMPAYCYLLFTVLLFDIGAPSAVIATVIFALAPAVRLTVARHPLRARRSRRGRRGPRRHRPPGAEQGAVAAGPPVDPARRQPGDHDGLRRRRHRRARRIAGPRASRSSTGWRRSTSAWRWTPAWPSSSSPSSSTASRVGGHLAERRAHARRPVAQKRRDLLIGLGILTVGIVIARLARRRAVPRRVDLLVCGSRSTRRSSGCRTTSATACRSSAAPSADQRLPRHPAARAAAPTAHGHALVGRHRRHRDAGLGHRREKGGHRVGRPAWWPSAGSSSGMHSMDTLSQVLVAVVLAVVDRRAHRDPRRLL